MRLSPALLAATVFAVGTAFAFWERHHLTTQQDAERVARFDALTERAVAQVNRRIQVYEYGLRGTRGAVITTGIDDISRAKFRIYSQSRELAREFPGSRGFGFIRRVPLEELPRFLQRARADGEPDFNIKELAPHDGDRLVIQYIEPQGPNQAAVGLDIASESLRRQAALEATRSGEPTLTHPITLVQDQGKPRRGFLFLLPAFRAGQPIETPEQRQRASIGFAYTPIVIDDVLADLDLANGAFSLALHDQGGPEGAVRFFASEGVDEPELKGLVKHFELPVYGRKWSLEVRARAAFVDELNQLNADKLALEISAASGMGALMLYLLLHSLERRRQARFDHAKLAAIVESSSDAIISKDLNGVVTSWNRAAERIFGYTAEEAIGVPLRDLIVPDELSAEEDAILAAIARGDAVPHRTTTRRRKDGDVIDVSVSVSPIRDPDGTVIGASKTARDITGEKARERRYRLAVDAAGVGVWVWHLQSDKLTWDQRMFELYGAPESLRETGLYYDYWKSHVHPEDVAHAEEKLRQHVAGTGVYDPTFRILRDDGEIRWIQASATVECDHMGHPIQMVGTNLDVTEQAAARAQVLELNASLESQVLQRTAELQLAVDQARRATEAKSEFLSNMSHEIRTPMNAILGLSYLLQRQALPIEAKGMVDKIDGAGRALLGIINDILDFSKIEASRLELERVPFRLSDVLDQVANIMAAAVGGKPVEAVMGVAPAGADYLMGDALRLGQVLINLVGNAVKFTQQGEVVVRVERLEAPTSGDVRLRFSVRDTGVGIPKSKQQAIFEAFSQADASTTRSHGGTGLGLTISSRLVGLMGGRLQVRSEVGRGSEFSFEATFGRSDPQASAVPAMGHLKVLIADDQPTALAAMSETARSLGWVVDAVASGEEAIEQVRQAVDRPYDVLLLDWKMPGMDGLQVAQTLRRLPGPAVAPVVIMTTAFDRERLQGEPGREALDFVLTKPITGSSLYDAVQAVKHRRGELEPHESAVATGSALAGLRVLVVDDSEINREVAFRVLSSEGATVELALDGQMALGTLTSRPSDFDVVLMDMQMPVMDGYTATRQLRSMPALARLPVIALTAGAFTRQRHEALAAGVDAFVAKPFDVDVLVKTIVDLTAATGVEPSRVVLGADAYPRHEQDEGGRAAVQAGVAKVLDQERALQVWRDPAVLARALRKFQAAYGNSASTLQGAGDAEAARFAHKLRGAAAQLGLFQVAAEAAALESRVGKGAPVGEGLAGLLQALEAAWAAIDAHAPAQEPVMPGASSAPIEKDATGAGRQPLRSLGEALQADDVERAERLLGALRGRIDEARWALLHDALAQYDLRRAEALVTALLDE